MRFYNKKIDLTSIPRTENGSYIWTKSIGCELPFEYEDIIGIIKILNYNPSNSKVTIQYQNKVMDVNYSQIINCALGGLLNKYTKSFKYEIGLIIKDEKRDMLIIDRKYEKQINYDKRKNLVYTNQFKKYKYKCLKCGYEDWIDERKLNNKHNCSLCENQVVVEGINDIPTTAPWMIPYFQGGYNEAKLYTRCSNLHIVPICPDCGRIKDRNIGIHVINSTHSIGCTCSDGISFPEKFMINFISQLHIGFNYQLTLITLKWCKGKGYNVRYDFYIPSLNCIIETHGGGHYIRGYERCGGRTLKEEQENDIFKEQLAKKNGIENYISVDCRKSELKWIKNSIMESDLPKLLNFKECDIDWNKCLEFACKNLVKEVCEYAIKNPENSIMTIAKTFKLSDSTIRKYLKNGNILGWCNYNKNTIRRNK